MLRFIMLEDKSWPIMVEYMFCPIMLRSIIFSSILLGPIMLRLIMLLSLMLEDLSIMPYMLPWEDILFILFLCIMLLDISWLIMLCILGLITRESSLREDESMKEVILVWRRSGSTERLFLS